MPGLFLKATFSMKTPQISVPKVAVLPDFSRFQGELSRTC
jgi:hypothetical protein